MAGLEGALRRALDFERESTRLVGAELTPIPEGCVVRTPSLPLVWSLNHVEVVAQVEDVYVAPSERGRGFGRALVTHATVLAVELGHEFVCIFAGDEGWPKQLYGKIGFEPVGRTWGCNLGGC